MKFFKKALCLLLAMLLSVSAVTTVMASGNIKVKLDGKEIKFDVAYNLKEPELLKLQRLFENADDVDALLQLNSSLLKFSISNNVISNHFNYFCSANHF